MKRALSLVFASILLLCSALSLASCGGITGTYEMTSIEGIKVVDGFRSEITMDDYDYYRITLNDNGTGILKSKLAGRSDVYKAYFSWSYEGTTLTLTNLETGNVQTMTLEDGVITIISNGTDGVRDGINMTLILEK